MKRIWIAAAVSCLLFSCSDKEKPRTFDAKDQNAIIENLLTRRSIRKYTDQQVPREKLDTIMKCAIYAPSAINKQSWEIRVVRNKKLLDRINSRFVDDAKGKQLSGSAANAQKPGFSVFHHAPTLIVVARDKANNSSPLDCGLMTENILLSAHALGLGTCAVGSVVPVLINPDNADLLAPLNLPDTHEVILTIALGYPDENPPVKPRYAEKVKYIE